MDICRIGLIGAGNVGRRHAQVLRSFPDVHLAGITDVVPEAAAALARDVGCRPFPGTGELLWIHSENEGARGEAARLGEAAAEVSPRCSRSDHQDPHA